MINKAFNSSAFLAKSSICREESIRSGTDLGTTSTRLLRVFTLNRQRLTSKSNRFGPIVFLRFLRGIEQLSNAVFEAQMNARNGIK